MKRIIDYPTSLEFTAPVYVDMRTETEYQQAAIPGAINLPIMTQAEHEEVSTLYVQASHELAKSQGIIYASQKLPAYFDRIQQLSQDHQVILYCSRGGYRSSVFFQLLVSLHLPVYKLEGGYKAYRHYLIETLPQLINQYQFVTLTGYTGVGKTAILHELQSLGRNVLDLEDLANHRGSVMGGIGLGDQPSQKAFDAQVFEAFRHFRGRYVFVEAESTRIGSVIVPKPLRSAYLASPRQVMVTADLNRRVQQIEHDYLQADGSVDSEVISRRLNHLQRYLSRAHYQQALHLTQQGAWSDLIEWLITHYYDNRYAVKEDQIEWTLHHQETASAARQLSDRYPELTDNSSSRDIF